MNGLVGLIVFLGSTFTWAHSLPPEIARHLSKSGRYQSTANGQATHESQGACTLKISPYGNSGLYIEAKTYAPVIAYLDGAKKSVESDGTVVFTTTENGRRPGGSVCGDYVPLVSYKQTIRITPKSVAIRAIYRCGFSKTDFIESCILN